MTKTKIEFAETRTKIWKEIVFCETCKGRGVLSYDDNIRNPDKDGSIFHKICFNCSGAGRVLVTTSHIYFRVIIDGRSVDQFLSDKHVGKLGDTSINDIYIILE